jgi:galactokinase
MQNRLKGKEETVAKAQTTAARFAMQTGPLANNLTGGGWGGSF